MLHVNVNHLSKQSCIYLFLNIRSDIISCEQLCLSTSIIYFRSNEGICHFHCKVNIDQFCNLLSTELFTQTTTPIYVERFTRCLSSQRNIVLMFSIAASQSAWMVAPLMIHMWMVSPTGGSLFLALSQPLSLLPMSEVGSPSPPSAGRGPRSTTREGPKRNLWE